MKTKDVEALYSEVILPTYTQTPICLVKGKGARVWDLHGKEYLDFFPGWAVSGLGHCHPAVVNAIKEQSRKIIHIPNNFYNLKQAQLAKEICKASFSSRVFFSNSGAEANEGAIKFVRKYGSDTGRYEVITMKKSFHGRTLATLTATGQEKVQIGFSPLPEGFKYAELNDIDSVKKLISSKTVAVMLEPIQGEGGVNVASQEFMSALRQICDERDMLLILDEVQTCMGRTGKMFAYQHYGLEPDIMTLAKSLGGGAPIGALVVNKKIKKDVFTPGSHGSTYGGNPLAAAAALAVFETIRKEKLLKHAQDMGNYFGQKLNDLKSRFKFITAVKGMAMMRALELSIPGASVVDKAREKGLLINCTQEKILRIFPPINISKKLLDEGLDILGEVLLGVLPQGTDLKKG